MPTKTENIVIFQDYTYWELTRLIANGPLVYRQTGSGSSQKVVSGVKHTFTSVNTKPWPTGNPTVWTPHSKTHYEYRRGTGFFEKFGYNASWPGGYYRTVYRVGDFQMITVDSPFGGDVSLAWVPSYPSSSALSSKLRGQLKSDFNAAVALAEVNKTFGLIGTNFLRIGQAFLDLKHGRIKQALSGLNLTHVTKCSPATLERVRREYRTKKEQQFAQRVLEVQYGWRPLIQDVYNAIEECKRIVPNATQVIRVGLRNSIDFSQVGDYTSTPYGSTMTQSYIVKGNSWRRFVAEYRVDDQTLNRVSNIGLLNPLAVGWELIPYSFVIDWALPIGNWINGMDATLGLTFLRGVEITKYDVTQVSSMKPKVTGPSFKGFARCETHHTQYSRVVKSDFPPNHFPSFKNPLSAQHALNGLALLVSSFHR